MTARARAAALLVGLGWLLLADGASADEGPDPWQRCAPCHGETGAGDGPAADLLWPRPRDLRGPLRLGADRASVVRAIRRGVPGTAMPAFTGREPAEIDALTQIVERIADWRGGFDPPVDDAPLPPPTPDEAARGAALWTSAGCAGCHGPGGAGDGPSAAGLRDADGAPADLYDLRTAPLKGGDALADVFRALTRGRPGTPMAAFVALPAADRRALSAHVLSLRTGPISTAWRLPPPDAPARARDDWWGVRPLPDPGPPPPELPPSLVAADPLRCGTCHPAQHASWRGSRHALAAGPGLVGQYHGAAEGFATRCNACHAPLAVQQRDPARHAEGVTCAACHVRAHRKHGPPGPGSARLPAPGVAAAPTPRFGRSDLCLPCHNLPLSAAVEGRPLLDTWREWAASPYLPAGVQCQHCHMPGGDHGVAGAHDPEMARRAVRLEVAPPRIEGGAVVVEATVRNVGAGHHFPTTATPRAVLRVRQLGPDGPIVSTAESWAIGRTLTREDGRWREVADTRIPAGEARARRYRRPRHPDATRVEVSLHLFPDWFYARFFRARLAGALAAPARADFEAALAEAEGSAILIDFARLDLPVSAAP